MSTIDDDVIPSATVTAPEAPTNSDATTNVPINFEICERSGFRVKPGTLIKEWNGVMVRPELWEARHPQDFVRSKPDRLKGSVRPEQKDRFIEDLFPNDVQPSDL